ncbi:related to Sly41p [Saccharomycodes ludwigii]|uniref:Related to Sly41p n=2 Tax=Saccharomycodes ludwigii TaxID=36035 RepID=A0A376BD19_9ASCO|nr:related to Sly41p [Saccharomycodes ludwigii]
MTYITLVPLILGVMITCASTHKSKKMNSTNNKNNNRLSDFAAGLIFAFISMIIFVSQNIFAKNILTVKRKDTLLKSKSNENVVEALRRAKQIYSPLQIDKITILFYCSCIGFLLDLPLFIYNEFSTRAIFSNLSIQTFLLILIHGVSHFIQAMLAFQLIGSLTPVNYSVANIMKRIVVILVALFWENRWSFNQVFGMSLTIFGLYSYDKWGKTKL